MNVDGKIVAIWKIPHNQAMKLLEGHWLDAYRDNWPNDGITFAIVTDNSKSLFWNGAVAEMEWVIGTKIHYADLVDQPYSGWNKVLEAYLKGELGRPTYGRDPRILEKPPKPLNRFAFIEDL